MKRAFIIRPFGSHKDQGGHEINFDSIDAKLIRPALVAAELGGGTTREIIESGNIRDDMFSLILEADLVICDLTIHNANVFYELGIRQALRKKRSVLIRGEQTADVVPFDILTDRYLTYDPVHPDAAIEQLTAMLKATLANEKTDSPIFRALPGLPEVDPASVYLLHKDLTEEVDRAKAAKASARLRLLSQEVESLRFQWAALRAIGRAQWDIDDFEGALRTYQKLIVNDEDDLDANAALANLYERQYRRERRSELLAKSDNAIRRVLTNNRATQEQRTEALSLIARNAKTQWRQDFEDLPDVEERRKKATSRQLIEAYDESLKAYSGDLKSCLAALQMCATAKSLAEKEEEAEAWANAFDNEVEADAKKKELAVAFDQLKGAVKLAVQAARKKLPVGSDDRKWADLSNADLLFLTEPNSKRVINAYKGCLPLTPGFASASKAELQLFAKLGINTTLAEAIIAELDPPSATGSPVTPTVVIVVGHRVDDPGRAKIRLPESEVSAVKDRLHEKLKRLNQGTVGVHVLACAAPGTDIVCHEVCRELNIKSTICLPTPRDDYSAKTFTDDRWRSRFLELTNLGSNIQQLSDAPGLPKWLQGTGADEWERGNRWVLQLALSAGAPKVSLIAVWDGNANGDKRGGTAHMVQIARAAGTVDVDVIELKDGAVVAAGP